MIAQSHNLHSLREHDYYFQAFLTHGNALRIVNDVTECFKLNRVDKWNWVKWENSKKKTWRLNEVWSRVSISKWEWRAQIKLYRVKFSFQFTSDKLIWQQRKEANQVNSFTKRSTVYYGLIELICMKGKKSSTPKISERERMREREMLRCSGMGKCSMELCVCVLALIGLFKLRLKKVKNQTHVMHLSAW